MPINQIILRTVGRFCSCVDVSGDSATVDLSEINFFSPFGLVYLGMFIRHYSSRGKSLSVTFPHDSKARGYLSRQQFWERFRFDEASIQAERQRRLTTSTSFNDIIDIPNTQWIGDEIELLLQGVLSKCGAPLPAKRVARIVGELVDNFAQHSGKHLAACCVQYYPNMKVLRVGIADCGIGIRASLSSSPKYGYLAKGDHSNAIVKAVEPGVTRKSEGGVGFTDITEGVEDLNGWLYLCSGDAYLEIKGGMANIGAMHFELPGVQVELVIPAGN